MLFNIAQSPLGLIVLLSSYIRYYSPKIGSFYIERLFFKHRLPPFQKWRGFLAIVFLGRHWLALIFRCSLFLKTPLAIPCELVFSGFAKGDWAAFVSVLYLKYPTNRWVCIAARNKYHRAFAA